MGLKPLILSPNSTFSCTFKKGNKANDCHTKGVSLSCGFTLFIRRLLNLISPDDGISNPASILNVVVFPHPEGPIMARNSPFPISKLISFTAGIFSKFLQTFLNVTSLYDIYLFFPFICQVKKKICAVITNVIDVKNTKVPIALT